MTGYHVRLGFVDVPPDLPEEDLRRLLPGHQLRVTRSWSDRLAVELVLPDGPLLEAVGTVLAGLAAVPRLPDPQAVEVLTTEEAVRRGRRAATEELLSVSEAARLLGLTRQAVLRRIGAGTLAASKVGSTYTIARSAVLSR